MTITKTTRDHLLADIELADSRLRTFDERLDDVAPAKREPYQQRQAQIAARCTALKQQIIDWPEPEIGTSSAIEDLSAALDALEADFEAWRHADPIGYRAAVDRQLRAWRSRSDWMKVQGALATMEIKDDFDEVGHRLASARAGALVELRDAADDAKDLVIDLRDDVEEVLLDVRHAIERAADALIHGSKH